MTAGFVAFAGDIVAESASLLPNTIFVSILFKPIPVTGTVETVTVHSEI